MATVFMPLVKEGPDTWRPVEVTPLEGAAYRVEGPMPDGEIWQFAPGSLIQIKWKNCEDGERRLIPTGLAPTGRSMLANYLRFNVGIWIGIFPLLLILDRLPRQPEGPPETMPALLVSMLWASLAALALVIYKPKALVPKWMALSALCLGVLISLLSAADLLSRSP